MTTQQRTNALVLHKCQRYCVNDIEMMNLITLFIVLNDFSSYHYYICTFIVIVSNMTRKANS